MEALYGIPAKPSRKSVKASTKVDSGYPWSQTKWPHEGKESLKEQNATLSNENHKLNKENNILREENQRLKEEKEEWQSEKGGWENEKEEWENEKEEWQNEKEEWQKEKGGWQNEKEEWWSEKQGWKAEKRSSKKVIQTLNRENQTLTEEKWMWNKKNQELIKENEQLKNEINNLRSKEQFILPVLLKEEEEEGKNTSKQEELNYYENLKIGNEISQKIVTEWNQKIQFVLKEYKQPGLNKAEGDDKCIKLLRSKELLFQEMRQISDSSKSLFQNLNTQYNAVQSQSVQLNARIEEISKAFLEIKETHEKQFDKTQVTYKICKEMFGKYEQMVKLRNELLLSKIAQQKRQKDFEQEQMRVQDLEKQCKQWLDSSENLYKTFTKELSKLENVLTQEYRELEKTWFKWSPEVIVFFIQKCLGWWNASDKLELLKKMQMTMIEKEIDGKNMHQVGKDVLMNVLGLSMPAAIKIEQASQYLFKKYPVQPIYTPQVPDKFLCPISGKIMEDPVDVYVSDDIKKDTILASDQLTYDRSSITRHLAEYPGGTSIHNKVRIIDNAGLAIEIHEFWQNHPEFQKNITPGTPILNTKMEGEGIDNETQEKEGI